MIFEALVVIGFIILFFSILGQTHALREENDRIDYTLKRILEKINTPIELDTIARNTDSLPYHIPREFDKYYEYTELRRDLKDLRKGIEYVNKHIDDMHNQGQVHQHYFNNMEKSLQECSVYLKSIMVQLDMARNEEDEEDE